MNSKNITVALIISIAILSRLIYHPPNFTPLFSVCIFSGALIVYNYDKWPINFD